MRRTIVGVLVWLAACKAGGGASNEAVARGRALWASRCANCHGSDPSKSGPLGPPVVGATRALVEARVLRAQYPEGYQPKRATTLMVAMPDLADSIDEIVAFLEASE